MLRRVAFPTVKEYTRTFHSLILYVLRWDHDSTLVPSMPMTAEMKRHIGRLAQALVNSNHLEAQDEGESAVLSSVGAIMSHYPMGTNVGAWDSTLGRWFILFCRRRDGSFLDAHGCTKPMSSIMWAVRVVFYDFLSAYVKREDVTLAEKHK